MKRIGYRVGKSTVSCIETGEEENPRVLFLHGIPASAELWRETMQAVSARGFYCMAPDLPGYGLSEVKETRYFSLPGSAQLLIRWLEEQALRDIWLVAHDLGGAVAQLMLTDKPAYFTKTTLSNVATADTYPVAVVQKLVNASKMGLYYWLAVLGRFREEKLYEGIKGMFIRKPSFSREEFKRIFYDGKFHRSRPAANFQKMLASLDSRSTVENMAKLTKLEVPVHLLWAMNDPFQSWEVSGGLLERTLANVRVSQIENCGHYLQMDAPEEFVQKLLW